MDVEVRVRCTWINSKLLKEAEKEVTVIGTNEARLDESSERLVPHGCESVGKLHDRALEKVLGGVEQCSRMEGVPIGADSVRLWPW